MCLKKKPGTWANQGRAKKEETRQGRAKSGFSQEGKAGQELSIRKVAYAQNQVNKDPTGSPVTV